MCQIDPVVRDITVIRSGILLLSAIEMMCQHLKWTGERSTNGRERSTNDFDGLLAATRPDAYMN